MQVLKEVVKPEPKAYTLKPTLLKPPVLPEGLYGLVDAEAYGPIGEVVS